MKKQKNFISKLKLIWQINKIQLFYSIIGVVELLLILIIASFNNRLLEMIITIFLFFVYRSKYEKQFHAETLMQCAVLSVIIFGIISAFIPSKNISILASVFVPYYVTLISYYIKDYNDKNKLLTKKLESMTYDEMKARFTTYTEYEIKAVYSYINRGEKLADHIAMKYNYSTRQLQRIIKKMKDELK